MNVCFANNYLYMRGGSERVMFAEADMLRRSGHTVTFFSRRGSQDIETAHADYYPPLVDVNTLGALGKLRQMPKIVYNYETARAFRRFLGDVRPQALHAHNIYGGLTASVLDVIGDAGIPAVLTVHDYKLVCPSYLALNHGQVCDACGVGHFYRCLLKRCHKSDLAASAVYTVEAYVTKVWRKYAPVRVFICPSRFMMRKLEVSGWAADRLAYLPNSIDASAVSPAIGEGNYALYVGRLSAEKGLMTLLNAVEGLDLPLRIVGDGPLRGELEAHIEGHAMCDRVRLIGHLSGDALADAYRGAAFCVMPSEWYENAPMAALEAFAYGKPVLGADIGGIPELVEEGKTGFLFPSRDAAALRNRMQEMWRERGSLGDLGAPARRIVETVFSHERHLESLLDIYSAVRG